jgi:cytidylate kinase
VICISHATGAGGRAVGRLVADRLGFRLVDEEIVARAAEREDLNVADLADVERRKSLLARLLRELGHSEYTVYGGFGSIELPVDPLPDPRSLRGLIRQTITETADDGDVVIVSHAASHALTDRDDVLRVLVTASTETRVGRLAEAEGLDDKSAKKSIQENDAGRADYLKRFYGVGSESPNHYDVVINTDRIAIEAGAGLIVNAASL